MAASRKFGRMLKFEIRVGDADSLIMAPARQLREYELLGYRAPKKGEHYVSGAIPAAYLAPNDLTTPYHVVRPLGLPLGEMAVCGECGRPHTTG